jgi:hypothetical protein
MVRHTSWPEKIHSIPFIRACVNGMDHQQETFSLQKNFGEGRGLILSGKETV